jgi:hypothetical protein
MRKEQKMKMMKGRSDRIANNARDLIRSNGGMELVQVAILIAIAIVVGLIFRTQIQDFVEEVFSNLSSKNFL